MPDVLVVGRLLADIYPNQLATRLAEIRSFTRFVGGFAGNVATGLARLGVHTAILSGVGDDGHGEFCRAFLEREGVDTRWLCVDPAYRTALAFIEAWPPNRFPITYYRTPTCPDWRIDFDTFPMDEVRAIPWCLLTGTGLVRSPSRDVHLALAQERTETATLFDLDFRAMLWDDIRRYRTYGKALLPHMRLVVGNESEFEALTGLEPLAAARSALAAGVETVILKRGSRGLLAFSDDREQAFAGLPIEVVNGLGAGDAFMAALVATLLEGRPIAEACERGNAAGAIVATRLACSEAMPTAAEVDALLDTGIVPEQGQL